MASYYSQYPTGRPAPAAGSRPGGQIAGSGQKRPGNPLLRAEMNEVVTRERQREVRTEKMNHFFKVLIIILAGVILLELVFHFVISPQMVIRSIKISAGQEIDLTNRQILELAELAGGISYLNVDTRKAEQNLLRNPLIQTAQVKKHFPDGLEIILQRRTPLGFALEKTGAGVQPLVFDENGIVFQVGADVPPEDLPVISGISFPDPRPGLRLPENLGTFLKDLAVLKSRSPELFALISELKFVKKNANEFEVLLYPKTYKTKVRIGSRINENLLKNILMVLDMVERENIASSLEELDFRSSKIVYKIREE